MYHPVYTLQPNLNCDNERFMMALTVYLTIRPFGCFKCRHLETFFQQFKTSSNTVADRLIIKRLIKLPIICEERDIPTYRLTEILTYRQQNKSSNLASLFEFRNLLCWLFIIIYIFNFNKYIIYIYISG